MLYRIYVPALEPHGVSMTIDVEATNWMLALRLGLDEIGADRDLVRRAICDIKPDKTIHVMEPVHGRVFVLRELLEVDTPDPQRAKTARIDADTGKKLNPAAEPAPPPPARVDTPRLSDSDNPDRTPTRKIPLGDAERVALRSTERAERKLEAHAPITRRTSSAVMNEDVASSARLDAMLNYPLEEADLEKYFDPPAPSRSISHLDLNLDRPSNSRIVARSPTGQVPVPTVDVVLDDSPTAEEVTTEDLMARVFEEMADLSFMASTVEEALEFALHKAVELLPSEAGWLLLADPGRRDLYFAAAVGLKSEEVVRYRLPMGKGIAGFCAVNGMSMTLSDVDQDPRFQMAISKQVGLEIRSVAAAPIQHGGRVFGALQVMNHMRRAEYTTSELDVLTYIAARTAEFLAEQAG